MLLTAERAGAEGMGYPGCPAGTIGEATGVSGSGTVTVTGLTFQFTPTGQGTASFTVSGGTFTGTIFVKGGNPHNPNTFEDATGGTVMSAVNPNNNQLFGISHIDICVTESDGNGEPPNGEPPNGEPPNGEEPTDGGEQPTGEGQQPTDEGVAPTDEGAQPSGHGPALAQEDVDQAPAPADEVEDPVGRETLARTGLQLVPLGLLGASMLFAGLGLSGAVRRRR